MTLLQRAGVDFSKPEPVRAVVDQLDRLVTQLEEALRSLKKVGTVRTGFKTCRATLSGSPSGEAESLALHS
jgi:hypothetical protein